MTHKLTTMNNSSRLRLAVTTILLLSFLHFSCNEGKDNKTETGKEPPAGTKGNAENGQYLVTIAGCLDCHSQRQFEFFSGPIRKGTEGMGGQLFDQKLFILPGTLYSKNITSDTATGIGNWTDAELIRAITQGISRNGDSLFPLMPYDHFSKLAKQDVLDIVAFIRTLPPIENKVPARQLMGPIGAFYASLPNTLDQNQKPSPNDKVEYGKYLVNMASCQTCHTPLSEKGVPGEPFSGGLKFTTPTFTVQTANLTSDSATGLGTWTEERFLNKFKTYREASGYVFDPKEQNSYMPWSEFAKMNNDDLSAIFAFLKTLPPVKHLVEKYPLAKK
jgi:mono/diheme cytochrome c family protein